MKFLLGIVIFAMGILAPSIYNDFINNHQFFWLTPLIFMFVSYGTYKIKFRDKNQFRLFMLRKYIRFKWMLQNINSKIHQKPEDTEILPIQTKCIRLWKLLLKDDSSQISCSLGNRIRQIEKDNMLLILSPLNQLDFQLTIMDVDLNKSCLYEIPIHSKLSENLIEVFDNENEKRMNKGQLEKRQSIHSDLDKLISQQEISLKHKHTSKF